MKIDKYKKCCIFNTYFFNLRSLMLKSAFFMAGLLFFQVAAAQSEKDTVVYYMKNSGKVAAVKDSADYIMYNMPAKMYGDKSLYPVVEVYRNGSRKLTGYSYFRTSRLYLEDSCINFFPNGRRKSAINYQGGEPMGEVKEYYPNGQLYASKTYDQNNQVRLTACRDSTGKVLAENGSGNWLNFDEDFKKIVEEGKVANGVATGEWHGMIGDTGKFVCTYKGGIVKSGIGYDKSGKAHPFTQIKVTATYKDGTDAFGAFLIANVTYPADEKAKHTKGKVSVAFFVEKDGSLTDVEVYRSVSKGLDEEALRVIKLSKLWTPEYEYGMPVRSKVIVPIAFANPG
jgi:TonB family protein